MWARFKVAAVFIWHGVHSPQFIAVVKWFLKSHPGLSPAVVAVISGLIEAVESDVLDNQLPATPGAA